ncbi:histidine kinase N-terminal 7TM domain-containing protein [Sphaerochaeta sp.]|uniref:sensor histidine kinase n=1 Tax=Sphaerochaeta sp. TaxID=1972642 RepID=UPI003D10830A
MFDYQNYALNGISYVMLFFLCLLSGVTYGALKRTGRPALRFFAIYIILVWVHCASYFFQISALSLDVKLFWANVKVSALCLTPSVWLYFSYLLTSNKYLNKKITAVLVAVAVLNMLVIWNDQSLHLFRESVELYKISDSISIMKPKFGIWFLSVYIWSLYIPVIVSILMFLAAYINTGKYGRFLYGIMIVAMVFALVAGIPQVVGLTYIDSYAISIGLTTIVYFILVHKYHIFGIMPLSNSDIVDIVETGILIYGSTGKLVEVNSAARPLFETEEQMSVLHSACKVLKLDPEPDSGEPFSPMSEIISGDRIYTAKLKTVKGYNGHIDGYIIFITDATEHYKLVQAQKDRELAEQKSAIIGDIHDNISGSISVISLLAAGAIEDGRDRETVLEKIRSISADTCKEVRLMMNTYERRRFVYKDLVSDMRNVGDMLTDGTRIDFRMTADMMSDMKYQEISFDIYINLMRLFKECVINCVKHSGAATLDVAVGIGSGGISMLISDNGCGFGSEVKKGRGLKNMHHRAKSIGGEVTFDGSAGTVVRCFVPLKEG